MEGTADIEVAGSGVVQVGDCVVNTRTMEHSKIAANIVTHRRRLVKPSGFWVWVRAWYRWWSECKTMGPVPKRTRKAG